MTFELLLECRGHGVRAWLDEPGFSALYVRIGALSIPTGTFDRVIQLASFEVEDKGKGIFTSFVKRIESYDLPIFVENVLNKRLTIYLPKIGFTKIEYGGDRDLVPCFFKDINSN